MRETALPNITIMATSINSNGDKLLQSRHTSHTLPFVQCLVKKQSSKEH